MSKSLKYLDFNDVLTDETRFGVKIKKEDYKNCGKHPIIDQGQNHISGYTDQEDGLYTDVPAIIFGDHTRVFKYIDKPFFLGADGVKLLKCKEEDRFNHKYLYYYMLTVNIPNTGYNRHFKWLKEIKIPLVTIELQEKIVEILENAYNVIELRKKQIEKLDNLIQSIFYDMFGAPLFNSKKWLTSNLENYCTNITDGEHNTPIRASKGIYLLSARNILNHSLQLDDVDYIDEAEYVRISKRIVPKYGDILISCSGSVGRVCRVKDYIKFQMVRSVAILQLKETVNSIFIEYLFDTNYMQSQIINSINQSSQANLFQGKIKKLKIIIPPIELQNQFADYVLKIEEKKSLLEQSLEQLELNYKSLMERAFNETLFE